MTTEAERAAEEYAQKYEQSEESRTFIGQQKTFQAAYNGFLKGHAHALTPRKINLGQPDTYPPFKADVLLYYKPEKYWSVGYVENEDELHIRFKDGYSYWMQVPPTPQGER